MALLLVTLGASCQIVTVHHECGDLTSCLYVNDNVCDDGGPGASYWECPRYSDATDCGTLCEEGHASPPPPTCDLNQWASTASADSSYSRLYTAEQATGPPSHQLSCAAGLAGSWTPEDRDANPHWLIVNFAQRAYPHSLRIWEHANPRTAAGFVRSVDLRSDLGWIENVWQLGAGEDQTVCGGTLTLYAANSPIAGERSRAAAPRAPRGDVPAQQPCSPLAPCAPVTMPMRSQYRPQPTGQRSCAGLEDLNVDAARIHTQTTFSGWEYIDAVQVAATALH